MENVDTILVTFKDGTSEIYSKKSMKRFRKKFFPETLEKNISQISQPALDPRYKTMSVSYNPIKGNPHQVAKELEHSLTNSNNVYMPNFSQ